MRIESTFLALVTTQALHSVEECTFRLYEVFPPARFLTGLVSRDLRRGFLVINFSLLAYGLWCYLWPMRRQWPSAPLLAWIWIGIEIVNGVGHPAWSAIQRGYTPGVATAPILLVLALYLARQLFRAKSVRNAGIVARG